MTDMKKIIIIFALFLFLSCKKKELEGVYVANHKEGADTLIINQNHTYRHHFISNEGKKYIKEGTWENGAESGWIDFANFDWHLKGFGVNPQDTTNLGFWGVEVEYDLWGNPLLTIDIDRNLEYKYVAKTTK